MERAVRRERMGLEGVRTAARSDMSSMVAVVDEARRWGAVFYPNFSCKRCRARAE
jgi:hypothetical protein